MEKMWRLDSGNEASYLKVCNDAAKDDSVFNTFRRSQPFRLIVENSPLKSGQEYSALIRQKFPWLLSYMDKFMLSDKIGDPQLYKIDGVDISPSTLRYIKTLGDLRHFFGPLNDMRITEIGGGYGGLCKIIHDVYKPEVYRIFDLPAVTVLQSKFLHQFGLHGIYHTAPAEVDSDLVIAMYSWSELDNDLQREYLAKVISRSKNCYIMINYDMEFSYNLLKGVFKECDIKDYNLFYDDNNTEYAPYNRFIIIKCLQQNQH